MTNLVPYQAERDQIKSRHWSNPYNPYVSTSNEQSYHDSNYSHQFATPEICADAASVSTTNTCITYSTVMSNLNGGNNLRVEQRQPYPSINEAYQQRYTERSETPRLQMFVPETLTLRQIENYKLEERHKNINKRLNPGAQKRVQASKITKKKLNQAKLVKKTKTSRRKKKVTPDNVRYLETVDGVENHNVIKMEQAAKMRAVWMVSDPEYQFNGRAGIAAWSKSDLVSNQRNSSTMIGPFV